MSEPTRVRADTQEVHDAVARFNLEQAVTALRRGGPSGAQAIAADYPSVAGFPLTFHLRLHFSGDDLVRGLAAVAGLSETSTTVSMGKALIPLGTRDTEVFRLLEGADLGGRATLRGEYDTAFRQGNTGTLYGDLADDLASWARQKSWALLERDLTGADHLYFSSLAITGTHDQDVLSAIQGAYLGGTLRQLRDEWQDVVVGRGANNEKWTSLTLREAMASELSGETWQIVAAALDSAERPDGELAAAKAMLEAATTGGFTGWGTNEEQVYLAVEQIAKIWDDRIARAAPGEVADLIAQRDADKEAILATLEDELSGTELAKARLLLAGSLSDADKLWLAAQDYDDAQADAVVTAAWGRGGVSALLADAEATRSDSRGVIRPRFDPRMALRVTSGHDFSRVYVLMYPGTSDADRGVRRVELELGKGSGDAVLTAVRTVLASASPGLRTEVLAALAAKGGAGGAPPGAVFLDRLLATGFELTGGFWDLADLLVPPETVDLVRERAQARYEAAHSGLLDGVLGLFVSAYDSVTAEDTAEVSRESLDRVQGSGSLDAASKEYEAFKARLADEAAVQSAVADALATAAELAVKAAITAATGGAGGWSLVQSIATAIAGMLTKEALLGSQFELASDANLKELGKVVAKELGGNVLPDFLKDATGDALKALGPGGRFLDTTMVKVSEQLNEAAIDTMFDQQLPGAEELARAAIAVVGTKSVSALMQGPESEATEQAFAGVAAVFREELAKNIKSGLVGSVTGTAASLVKGGIGNASSGDIALRFGSAAASGMAGAFTKAADKAANEAAKDWHRRRAEAAAAAGPNAAPADPPE